MRRFPKRPTQRDVDNALTFMAGGTQMRQSVKRGPQPEGKTNEAVAEWAALHPELFIGRNKRRLATPPGMKQPIMLGWLIDGSSDWIGWRRVTITPGMVGATIAQFVALESKRADGGVVSDEQELFLNRLKDDGGVAAVVRSADDAERALK